MRWHILLTLLLLCTAAAAEQAEEGALDDFCADAASPGSGEEGGWEWLDDVRGIRPGAGAACCLPQASPCISAAAPQAASRAHPPPSNLAPHSACSPPLPPVALPAVRLPRCGTGGSVERHAGAV